ncbi:guanylate-binding protein 3-like [Ctenodactylus gundi]
MASQAIMKAPICLVVNTLEQLTVNLEALKILDKISQPVVVVAIVGLFRTGKSYLMNRLAGQNHGFPLGSTVQSETKGIWMWCVPHPTKPNHTLVLLDTEGLGDVEKGDPKNDSWIFALAVLLSSAFIYNSLSTINHQALEQLHYVAELTQLIRAKSAPTLGEVEDSSEFVSFFPDFVWVVRDFMLELKLNGHPITEDEYLENALKLIPGRNPQIEKSNIPRQCIRYFFPVRKCFVFDRPTNEKELLFHVEDVPENQLEWNFQVQSKNFCSYIFTNAKTKMLRRGIVVTGNRLGTLVKTYVSAINSGAVPCLENAVTTLAQQENSAAVQQAAEHYSQQMAQRVRLPTDTLQELLAAHAACEKEAIAVFMERSFKDENQEFQKELVNTMERKKEDFLLQNEAESAKYCQAELEKLSAPLMESISKGAFSVPGGHSLYLEAKNQVEQGYKLVPRRGVKGNEVLQSFLKSQNTIEKSILESDKALTEGQKAIAAERAKKEAAEKEQELLRQQQKEMEQKMEAQEKSFRENMAQLKEKMEREKADILREQDRMLEHKLKVQKELLMEGFEKQSEALQKEINQLNEEIEKTKEKKSLLSKAFDTLGNACIVLLPGAGKLLGERDLCSSWLWRLKVQDQITDCVSAEGIWSTSQHEASEPWRGNKDFKDPCGTEKGEAGPLSTSSEGGAGKDPDFPPSRLDTQPRARARSGKGLCGSLLFVKHECLWPSLRWSGSDEIRMPSGRRVPWGTSGLR